MKKYLIIAFLLFANTYTLFADDPGSPCGGNDPDASANCPIDTWIIVFAVLALIITTIHLHKKQTMVRNLSNN